MENLTPYFLYGYYTQHKKNFRPDFVFDKRITNNYELVYFLDDSCCKMLLDDKEYHIVGDTVVFRRPHQLNQSFMPYESILLGFSFTPNSTSIQNMDEKYLSDYNVKKVDHPLLNNIATIHKNLSQANYRKIFEDIYKESLLGREFANHYFSAKIMEILYGLYYEKNTTIQHHEERITNENLLAILHYIDAHLERYFTVQRMSIDLSISERYIYKLFKEHLNITPIQYINECRLNYSKKLLDHSNIAIHQVAGMSGYDNSTYFITLFKKRYGLTPLQYRNSLTKE